MMHHVQLVVIAALFLSAACVLWAHALPLLLRPLLGEESESVSAHTHALALHAALNAIALLVCTPSGLCLMLARKRLQDHGTRVWMTKLHLAVNVAAALLLSVAGAIAYAAKRAAHEKHFVSRHSWTGLSVALLLALNIFQGLLLTFEGKRTNWQWKDETHGLVGTLIYVGSAAALVFGIQSASWANSVRMSTELQHRLVVLVVAAHIALLGTMALSSSASREPSTTATTLPQTDDAEKKVS